ncbi:hypothetical protein DES52_101189 [Deinococcus yavapaiensis KR-236]|uniref:Uncharacterized protein n=2 Tax=Deinococcus TaxID=1298 RepID=A0A318SH05_9DEIO|nr:hypothetical protein DES52_101189 [Deinococcus yavapaiensis KR-236]
MGALAVAIGAGAAVLALGALALAVLVGAWLATSNGRNGLGSASSETAALSDVAVFAVSCSGASFGTSVVRNGICSTVAGACGRVTVTPPAS